MRPGPHTEVVIEAARPDAETLSSAVWVAGSLLCQRESPLPTEVAEHRVIWGSADAG